jgi:hypothetical protein
MSCFNKVSTATANSDLDLTKHVNYTSGMILGVDDFTQEFAYLAGRDRWVARDALGYGTVSGLKVQVDKDAAKGARVMVSAGVAISPRGQLICVSTAQCAFLNEWIAANDKDLEKHLGSTVASPPVASPHLKDELTLYVVLCYRDCPVDNVPIPGEPCRNEEDLMAASRIQDDFSLELRFDAPAQTEEDKVREYVEWLKQIKIVETGASTPIEEFRKAVRAKWLPTSPPTITSPPTVLQINAQDVCDYMRAAFRLWVTELRNALSGRKIGCSVEMSGGGSLEDCVLLAKLRVPLVSVSTGWKVSDSEDVRIDEEKRPFLLHLRMLQEWMLCSFSHISGTSQPITSPSLPSPVALKDLTDVKITTLKDGQVLIFDGTKWINKTPETSGGGVTDHGNLVGLDDDDHKQYLLISGSRAMTGNLNAGGKQITNLSAGTANGQAVIFEQAIKKDDDANGDLTGKYPAPTISKLQGKPVDAKPTEGQILTFKGGKWIADAPSAPSGVTKHSALTGLDADDHKQYLLIDGTRAMSGNLNSGGKQITNLAAATANDQAVVFQQAIKDGDQAGGDLIGTYPNPTINTLQGKQVKADSPNPGDMLVFDGTEWLPQPQPQIPTPTNTKPELVLPLATISKVEGALIYEIWFNIDAPGNLAKVTVLKEGHLRILDENDGPSPFTTPIRFRLTPRTTRNVFLVNLVLEANQPQPDRMRFNFDIREIAVEVTVNTGVETMTLFEYAKKNNIRFAGFLDDGKQATVFVRGTGLSA